MDLIAMGEMPDQVGHDGEIPGQAGNDGSVGHDGGNSRPKGGPKGRRRHVKNCFPNHHFGH